MPRPRRTYAAPPLLNFMGRVSRLSSYARARRAAPPPPATSQTPGEHPSPTRTTQRSRWRSYLLAGYLPAVCARNLPIHPLATNTLRVHTLGELLARCGMFWRADVSLRSHTHIHAPAPAAEHPAALTAPPPGACGHTPCLWRARPPYAPAHTWQAHAQSAL